MLQPQYRTRWVTFCAPHRRPFHRRRWRGRQPIVPKLQVYIGAFHHEAARVMSRRADDVRESRFLPSPTTKFGGSATARELTKVLQTHAMHPKSPVEGAHTVSSRSDDVCKT
jgi:hypothetical protein